MNFILVICISSKININGNSFIDSTPTTYDTNMNQKRKKKIVERSITPTEHNNLFKQFEITDVEKILLLVVEVWHALVSFYSLSLSLLAATGSSHHIYYSIPFGEFCCCFYFISINLQYFCRKNLIL